jgi:oligosaccharide repeat unit polymerase
MSAAFASGFFAIALANLWVGRSLLYPPALFSLAWAGYLTAAWVGEDSYLPVSEAVLLLFLGGALAVSLGGLMVLLLESRRPHGPAARSCRRPLAVRRLIDLGVLIVVLALPIRFLRLQQLGGALDVLSSDFWVHVRQAAILESDEGAVSWLALSDNLVLLSLFVALAAVADDVAARTVRLRTIVVVPIALFYQLSTASRSSGMALVCGLIGVAWLASGRWTLRSAALGALGGIVVFACAAVFMNKGGRLDAGLLDNLHGVADVAVLYGVGPIVAFDHAYNDPQAVPAVWSIGYSVVQVANKLGAGIALPSIHAEYSRVAPGLWMNVYTLYFAYVPDFGVAGALLLLCVIGAVLTWLFRRASAGDPRSRLLYATTLSAILMSGFNEQFFMNLSFYAKAAAFSLVLYGLPAFEGFRPLRRRAVSSAHAGDSTVAPTAPRDGLRATPS